MLLSLHVKNFALIDEADIEFSDGLNILTGETGAGKSILIGSVSIALGQKLKGDVIRSGADHALVELVFCVEGEACKHALREAGVEPDGDGLVIISRKLLQGRSVSKVNDETVTAGRLRTITDLLIDIHGQHEHQSLLYKEKHLEILDAFLGNAAIPLREEVGACYRTYEKLLEKMRGFSLDGDARLREAAFLQFEVEEIEAAGLKDGEEEELEARRRVLANAQKIAEALSNAHRMVEESGVGQAVRSLSEVAGYDVALEDISRQLCDAEGILDDASHAIASYLGSMDMDEGTFAWVQERLGVIGAMQAKYGQTYEKIAEGLSRRKARLSELENYEEALAETQAELEKAKGKLEEASLALSAMRRDAADRLVVLISEKLGELNFQEVRCTMEFRRAAGYGPAGYDETEFLVSLNPGEPVRPLGEVASGGELSRMMLAIKTVLADADAVETLIFDEIDAGISGRTAQKVSEQLAQIGKRRQVICITHLPQIAAMGDAHFEISKEVAGGTAHTRVRRLTGEQSVEELARLLGGAKITPAVLENAQEMRQLALAAKGT
ncbi:MAG: DNA repair protein RecN [Lachnospiraceae bacterium]|jgi:DNA repair protein RecN (Recombination protein N)|nr:DNA repair protein RecN [Lachnospiraceae bacterium]